MKSALLCFCCLLLLMPFLPNNARAQSGPVVVIYFDEALTQRTICLAAPGDTIVAYVVAENFTKPIVSIEYSVSYGACTFVSEEVLGGLGTGTAYEGIKIDFFSPMNASNQLLVEKIHLIATCSTGCNASGFSQSIAPFNHITSQALRAYDIDGWSVPAIGHAGFACSNGAPDLDITSYTAPASAMRYQNIASLLSLTVKNAGTDTVTSGVMVEYRLSTDTIFTSSDARLGYRTLIGVWPHGASRAVTMTTVRIPLNAPLGTMYLGAIVDPISTQGTSNIRELDETNNISYHPITILPDPTLDTTYVYAEDFQDGDGGWTPKDVTAPDVHWHWATTTDSRAVMYCGSETDYATPGYGHDWNEAIKKTYVMTGPLMNLDYMIQWDVETDYDFVRVQYSTDGSTYNDLDVLTGSSTGFVQRQVQIPGASGDTIAIRFQVTSDGAWDDQDGSYNSDGACRLDWVEFAGVRDNFDVDDDEWLPDAPPAIGGAFRLIYNPIYYPPVPGQDNNTTGVPQRACNVWGAYDPETGQFPFASPADSAAGNGVNIAIESPAIPITTDALMYQLVYDVYLALPSTSNVFYYWEISFPPYLSWVGNNTMMYGMSGWVTSRQDITSYMQAGATEMKIRLHGRQYFGMGGNAGPHTPSPSFDNVMLMFVRTTTPGVDVSGFPRDCEPADEDRDGIGDLTDLCPAEGSSFFDRDGDGCIGEAPGARHIEYLQDDTLRYFINSAGAPGIGDGSDITAIHQGVDAWSGLPGSAMRTQYLGTTAQNDANALDGVNIVTFSDPDYVFPTGVLGVGITTSFMEPDHYLNGRPILPGRVFDCDILFNPLVQFRTPTAGSGVDLRSVSTHEAGHLFGLSHSAVRTSTMFYVLPPDTQAASLEIDDRLIMFKAYPEAAALAAASRLAGTVTDGLTAEPVPGAIVFATDVASGDTVGSEYTLLDGSFEFVGLPNGSYYVSIYPLNGSSTIGYLQPGNINSLVNENAVTVFVPEFYDAAESSDDDPSARAAVAVSAGTTTTIAIVTNIDDDGPAITAVNPEDGQTGIKIDASILVSFSEPIDIASVSGDFRLVDTTTLSFVSGNAALVRDDSTLTFLPSGNLDFETVYRLEIGAGIQDKFGNPLGAAYQLTFTTELKPDVAITSLAPRKSVAGALVVVSGFGFEESTVDNVVSFNGVQATILEASSTRLLVTVPTGAATGNVTVTNVAEGHTSNALQFTVLPGEEVARGYEAGAVALSSIPRSIAVAPDGAVAFAATESGYAAVIVDPGDPGYLSTAPFSLAGGVDEIDVTPDGKRAYAVGRTSGTMYRINAERGAGGLADLVVLNEMAVNGEPLGILVEPAGKRAFVPTADGEIQIWDVSPPSATFDTQIGAISLPGKSLRGKMAIDPAGILLLVPTGAGTLLVYDIPGDSLKAEIGVGSDPRDVAVDPMGDRAYVTDGSGVVTIVSLEMLAKVIDVNTGGSLRSCSITPAGSFLYAVNRELNIYDVVDLRSESETYRSVAANIPLHVNPIDAELAPDGLYAYSLSETDRSLVVTAIGVGPLLRSMHPVAGRPGATIVLTGSDLAADESVVVSFGEIQTAPVVRRDSFIVVAVPPGAASGALKVIGRNPYRPDAPSNEMYFTVLGATTNDALRLAAKLGTGGMSLGSATAVSPAGKRLTYSTDEGGVHALRALDVDPASATLHQVIGETGLGVSFVLDETEITADGRRALVLDRGAGAAGETTIIPIVDMVPLSETFATVVGSIDVSVLVEGASALCASPTGTACAVAERGNAGTSTPASVHLFDLDTFGGNSGSPVGNVDVALGDINALRYHPAGLYCYLAMTDGADGAVRILDADPLSASFLTVTATVPLAGLNPTSLSFTPDGRRCLVFATNQGTGERAVVMLNTTNPASPATTVTAPFAAGGGGGGRIEVSPAGDRAILCYDGGGIKHLRIAVNPDAITVVDEEAAGSSFAAAGYLPDASRWYGAAAAEDSLYVYDFSTASAIALVSGDAQSGVVNQPLQAPLRVRVTGSGGAGVAGIPVTFEVTSGDGQFAGTGTAVQVAATDATGAARADWTLGSSIGAQTVRVSSTGLAGSPLAFAATALADPETLPLELVDISPLDSAIDVSGSTAVLATFSRALDPASVDTTRFYLLESGATKPVAGLIGMTDENRRLSITPRSTLKPNTIYYINSTAGLLDASGGPLQNPGSKVFRTGPPAELLLVASNPPSSLRGVPVVLSGSGFDAVAANNTVYFNDVPASVTEASNDHLDVVVPASLMQGSVLIETAVGELTSNQLPFRVLAAETTAIDKEVIANIGTGSSTKSVAVTPDGARLYAVSPMMNLVVCVDIWSFSALPAIPVGQNPHTIKINPAGTSAYVTNFLDNTVSVIDIGTGSGDFNRVTETIPVGQGPRDVILTPDGDRLIVSNAGSSDLSIVDTDESSSTFNQVLATVSTGTSTKSIAVTPDGGYIYLGTKDGYLVVDLVDFGVVKSVDAGTSTKSVAVTPDGAYLILLTTAGSVLIYDISPGSATMDQVVGTVTTGSTTKSVAVTPDGGMLYLLQEQLDAIIAFRLNHVSAAGALRSPDRVGRYLVYAEPVDTMYTGEDPAEMCFSPDGSGIAVVTNAGDNTVSIYNPFAEPIAVALSAFDVRPVDRGAVLAWSTLNEEGVDGFVLSRAAGSASAFEPLTAAPIPARGAPASYSHTDEGVRPNVTYRYRLEAVDGAGERTELGTVEFTPRARFALEQNVPNPFNPSTRIRFSVAEAGRVQLAIYDVLGRRVRSLVDRPLAADYYEIVWDGRNNDGLTVASGVYFCRLEAGKFKATKKMVLLR